MYQVKKLNAYFDNLEYEIKKQLQRATISIDICVAWISLNNFEDLFQKLINQGVNIRLICHKDFNSKRNNFSKNTCLREIYKISPYGGGLMHNKFCIIDDEILIIGSYNWSANAHRHFENIFVVENEFPSILRYKNEFEDLILSSYTNYGKCRNYQCNSTTINILVTTNDIENRENFYRLSIWELCLANNHCTLLHDELIEEYGWYEEEDEPIEDKERMLLEFKMNRNIIDNRMKKNNGFNIHAQANILINNEYDVIKYGGSEEYILNVYWKHIFFRNRINSEYYDDNDISKIIEWANGGI
jgi:hypothetical protein